MSPPQRTHQTVGVIRTMLPGKPRKNNTVEQQQCQVVGARQVCGGNPVMQTGAVGSHAKLFGRPGNLRAR